MDKVRLLQEKWQTFWERRQAYFQRQPQNIVYGGSALLFLFLITIVYGGRGHSGENAAPAGVPVRVAKVTRQDVENTISVVGTVHPVAAVAIKSRLDSQVMQVNFKDGDDVKEGDTLFILDDRLLKAQLQQLTADLARNTAELDRAARQLQRDEKLATKGYSSQAVYDTSKSAYAAAQANVNATKANMENIKTQLDFTVIKAPISGRAGTITVTQGNTVKANDTTSLVTINQMNPIHVKAPVPQRYYKALQAAMKNGEVPVTARDATGAVLSKGKILYKENAIDEDTRTLSVQATFENEKDQLWPGMFVEAVIVLGVDRQVLTVPLVSVRTGQSSSSIFVVRDGKALMKPVKVLQNHYDVAVIEGDVKDSDVVVTEGFLSLKDNTPVLPRPAEPGKPS